MEWNTDAYDWSKRPSRGDMRLRKSFALVPRACSDGKTRWLEYISVEEKFAGSTLILDEYWVPIRFHPYKGEK